MNEILKAERLSKTYGKSIAVSEVSLTVRQGDIYGLIGKNGAGKTTFMRMVLGLASPDSGQMELFGKMDQRHSVILVGIRFKHIQYGRIAGDFPVISHFPKCNPDHGIEPVEDSCEGHQIVYQRVFVLVMLQLVQQHVADLAKSVYPGRT